MNEEYSKKKQQHHEKTISELEEIRLKALLKNDNDGTIKDFKELFQKLNINILDFWKKGMGLTATPDGWVPVRLDSLKDREEIKKYNPPCPVCGKRSLYRRRYKESWICYKCKHTFSDDEIKFNQQTIQGKSPLTASL